MRRASRAAIIVVAAVLAGGALIYYAQRPEPPGNIIGVVRSTEVRVEPEVNGQLVSIAVKKGGRVRAGDVLAKLSAVELTAQLDQARAALASATANRNNVYAGVRHEQVDSLKAQIDKANARLEYVQLQLTRTSTLAAQNFESQQTLDQATNDVASAQADVAEAKANYDAPVDGVVSVIAAEVGENVRPGQPILVVEAAGEQWLSFNAREDHLGGLAVG